MEFYGIGSSCLDVLTGDLDLGLD